MSQDFTRTMMIGKLHQACVTATRLDYEGSLSIDAALLEMAGILVHEQILVANLRNGARFVTYAIEAPAGSAVIQVNGAAAHHCAAGDRLIIMAFAQMPDAAARALKPRVVVLSAENAVLSAPALAA